MLQGERKKTGKKQTVGKKEENWKGKERKEKGGTIRYICLGKIDRDEITRKKIIINKKNCEKGEKNRQKDKTGAAWGKKKQRWKTEQEKEPARIEKKKEKKGKKKGMKNILLAKK